MLVVQVIHVGDTLKFQVSPGQRFLNVSVWLTGVTPAAEDAMSGKNSSKSPSSTTSPSKTSGAKSNLSNLFKKHSPLHQPEVKESKESISSKDLKEVPIGHINIYLPDVAADCHLNTQGHHISTYQLYPADAKTSLG